VRTFPLPFFSLIKSIIFGSTVMLKIRNKLYDDAANKFPKGKKSGTKNNQ
jgi:hypothetical protein